MPQPNSKLSQVKSKSIASKTNQETTNRPNKLIDIELFDSWVDNLDSATQESFISFASDGFGRIRFGIGRPVQKEFVPTYVLQNFREPKGALEDAIAEAVALILTLL